MLWYVEETMSKQWYATAMTLNSFCLMMIYDVINVLRILVLYCARYSFPIKPRMMCHMGQVGECKTYVAHMTDKAQWQLIVFNYLINK